MSDEPAGAIGLNPDWIGEQASAHFGGTARAEMAGFIGTGQMSRNARFTLDWVDGEGPASVVVKVPSGDDGTRTVSFDHGVYAKECTFYDTIAGLVDITTPEAIGVHLDSERRDFALILEDLSGSVQGDQFREATEAELRLAIGEAAALHAPVWNDNDGAVFDPFREDVEDRVERSREAMPLFQMVVLDRLADGLEPDMHPMLDRFTALTEAWVRARCVPQTLVHGDFRPDNFMLGVEASAPPMAVVDWQTVSLGRGAADVAYLIAGALSPERRRELEADLVEHYRSELARRGVYYDAAECQRDYALGAIHGIVIAVTATAMAERTERGDALFTQMINRHGRHALDLGSFDLL